MPPWLTTILGGGLGDVFQKIVGTFKASPDKVLEMQEMIANNAQALAMAEQAMAQKALEAQVQLNQIASDNIKTETSSSDWFVRRARPAFLWIMTLGIGFNMVLPLMCRAFGRDINPVDLSPYMSLFTTAFLGYVTARTVEKFKGND